MFKRCPGTKDLIGPQKIVIIRTCPKCESEVEFYDELEVKCPICGNLLNRETTTVCV